MKLTRTVCCSLALSLAFPLAAPATQDVSSRERVTPEVDYEPFWAPDGTRFVYISNVDGPMDVYLQESASPYPRTRLTSDTLVDDTPAWSPDGRQIVFIKELGGNSEIFLMHADGTNVRRLTDSPGVDIHPNWSPDGSRILFNSSRNSANPEEPDVIELFTMGIDGADIRQLTTGGITTYASWSPDGSTILARRSTGENRSEIVLMDPDGTHIRALAPSGHFDGWPSWSPDGRKIVFASDRSGDFRIYRMNADGTDARLIIPLRGRLTNPRWSPDGKRIMFTARLGTSPNTMIFQYPIDDGAP